MRPSVRDLVAWALFLIAAAVAEVLWIAALVSCVPTDDVPPPTDCKEARDCSRASG